jgi:hypothetical protein
MRPAALRRCAAALVALAGAACGASPAFASADDADWVMPLLQRMSIAREDGRSRAREGAPAHARRLGRHQRPVGARRGTHARKRALPVHASLRGSLPAHTSLGSGRIPPASAAPGAARPRRGVPLGTMVASLGREFMQFVPYEPPSLSGAAIVWRASSDCLAFALRTVLVELAASFGPLRVNSTCRSRSHNARVGGAKRSFHLTGNAADFRIAGSARPVLAFLRARPDVGGIKHYGQGVFHIDTGARRTW